MSITYKRINTLTEEVLRDGIVIGTVSSYAAVNDYWQWVDASGGSGNTTSKDAAVTMLTKGRA